MAFHLNISSDQARRSYEVAQRVDLQFIRLSQSEIRSPERLEDAPLTQPVNMKIGYGAPSVRMLTQTIRADLIFTLTLSDSSESPVSVLNLTAAFQAFFECSGDFVPQQADIEAFASSNGVFTCWPYFREYAQQVCARAMLPIAPLPFMVLRIIDGPESVTTENAETAGPLED